jgi:hypothetical protein
MDLRGVFNTVSANTVTPNYGVVAGGFTNSVESNSAILGGASNSALATYSVIGGGGTNLINFSSNYSFIGGGGSNKLAEILFIALLVVVMAR